MPHMHPHTHRPGSLAARIVAEGRDHRPLIMERDGTGRPGHVILRDPAAPQGFSLVWRGHVSYMPAPLYGRVVSNQSGYAPGHPTSD